MPSSCSDSTEALWGIYSARSLLGSHCGTQALLHLLLAVSFICGSRKENFRSPATLALRACENHKGWCVCVSLTCWHTHMIIPGLTPSKTIFTCDSHWVYPLPLVTSVPPAEERTDRGQLKSRLASETAMSQGPDAETLGSGFLHHFAGLKWSERLCFLLWCALSRKPPDYWSVGTNFQLQDE